MSLELSPSERDRIVQAIQEAGNNISKAARALGCSRRTLQNRMRTYRIAPGKAGRRKRDLPYDRTTKRVLGALGAAAVIGAGILGYRHLRKG